MGNLDAADNNQLATIRAVLISLYPKDVNNNSLVPKMRERGVDVVRVVNIERSPDFKPGDVDVIICMRDYFSHSLQNTVKTIARRYNRPLLMLTRKASDWEELLSGYVTKARQAPPASSPQPLSSPTPLRLLPSALVRLDEPEEAPVPEVSTAELRELLSMFEAENTRLEGEIKPLLKRLEETDALAGALEKRLESQVADAKEAMADAERAVADLKRSNIAFRANNTRLISQVQQLEAEKEELVTRRGTDGEVQLLKATLEKAHAHAMELEQRAVVLEQQAVVSAQTIKELRAELFDACDTTPSTGINKELLLTWDRLLRGVRAGNAPDFQALLEFSAKAEISAAELLVLLKG